VIAAARTNLSAAESRDFEEPLTEYGDNFAMKSDDCGRTETMYHRTDKGEARPIHLPPRRHSLVKQAEVGEMLDDMQRRGLIKGSDNILFFFFFLVCVTIGTAATSWPIVPASGDNEDDCGEQMECRLTGETEVLDANTSSFFSHRKALHIIVNQYIIHIYVQLREEVNKIHLCVLILLN
jgi:hypothetical protein